jgi:hypothetical protein
MSAVIDYRCDVYETWEINVVLITPIQTFTDLNVLDRREGAGIAQTSETLYNSQSSSA